MARTPTSGSRCTEPASHASRSSALRRKGELQRELLSALLKLAPVILASGRSPRSHGVEMGVAGRSDRVRP